MRKILFLAVVVMLGACTTVPEPGNPGLEGLSFVEFQGGSLAVFEGRGSRKVIFGDTESQDFYVLNDGQWMPRDPEWDGLPNDPQFNGKLLVPMQPGGVIVFEPPTPQQPEPDVYLLEGLDQNPCLPSAGCGGGFGKRLSSIFTTRAVWICPGQSETRFYDSREQWRG